MLPKRLSILGVGLLGGSLGLACKAIAKDCFVVGYAHNAETRSRALAAGAVDMATGDLQDAVTDADMVVLCTPVGLFGTMLEGLGKWGKAKAIVTDVGSTKRSVVLSATLQIGQKMRFVGSHPMAGSEKRGVEFARGDLFQNAVCILTPTADTDADALRQTESLWQTVGMRTTVMSPEDHDELVGRVSHVPHAVAAALVDLQSEGSLKLAGKGFLDTTRIAAGDAGLWRDILLDNADHVRGGIEQLQQQLGELSEMLQAGDSAGLKAWLEAAARVREGMGRR